MRNPSSNPQRGRPRVSGVWDEARPPTPGRAARVPTGRTTIHARTDGDFRHLHEPLFVHFNDLKADSEGGCSHARLLEIRSQEEKSGPTIADDAPLASMKRDSRRASDRRWATDFEAARTPSSSRGQTIAGGES